MACSSKTKVSKELVNAIEPKGLLKPIESTMTIGLFLHSLIS